MRQDPNQDRRASARQPLPNAAHGILEALALVAITTIALLVLDQFVFLRHVTLVYLVPVIIAATNVGMVPALVAAIAGGGAVAFFFYPPIYSFLVEDPQHLIELSLYVFVAVVTGHLATNLRRQADLARRRETEVHDLYASSRRLLGARTPSDIYTAIREHLASITGHRTILFETLPRGGGGTTLSNEEQVPERVKRATEALAEGHNESGNDSIVEDDEGRVWLVRPISGKAGGKDDRSRQKAG